MPDPAPPPAGVVLAVIKVAAPEQAAGDLPLVDWGKLLKNTISRFKRLCLYIICKQRGNPSIYSNIVILYHMYNHKTQIKSFNSSRKCTTDMDMQHGHGHAAWTWSYTMDMDLQNGHEKCNMERDIQHGQ
jgi:hypothetical protein